MLRIVLTCLLPGLLASLPVRAEPLWSFADVSINYLDWSGRTTRATGKQDFTFLEIEGGAGYRWGEVYGFFDSENPGRQGSERRTAAKGVLRLNLGESDYNLYLQVYDFDAHGFHEQNRVLGVGRNFTHGAFWIKPFLGVHHAETTFFNDWNGGMLGWVFGYDRTIRGEKFSLTNWTEIEFARDRRYLVDAAGQSQRSCLNGALALWWRATKDISLGLQYRYADRKLGSATYQDAWITTLRADF